MKETWQKLAIWWNQLSVREKRVVSSGGAVVTLFILYQCIVSPCLHHLETMRQHIALSQQTLLWMQSADKTMYAQSSSIKSKPVSSTGFLSEIQNQIKYAGLQQSVSQLKQSEDASVDVQFQKVEFDKLIRLLTDVTKAYRVTVTRLSILATDVPGQVNAEMLIHQSAQSL